MGCRPCCRKNEYKGEKNKNSLKPQHTILRTSCATCTLHTATYNHIVPQLFTKHIFYAPSLYDTTFIKIINATHNPHIYILYSIQKLNTLSHGQYSQVHKMRTLSSVFRATSLEILKGLSVGGNSGNTHFVRCIRADLEYNPRGFQVRFIST